MELLAGAAIDVGKIVLGAEGRPVPRTYGQILSDTETVSPFTELSGRLAPLAGLRNLLAREYLYLRFGRVKRFVDEDVDGTVRLCELAARWAEAAAGE